MKHKNENYRNEVLKAKLDMENNEKQNIVPVPTPERENSSGLNDVRIVNYRPTNKQEVQTS